MKILPFRKKPETQIRRAADLLGFGKAFERREDPREDIFFNDAVPYWKKRLSDYLATRPTRLR